MANWIIPFIVSILPYPARFMICGAIPENSAFLAILCQFHSSSEGLLTTSFQAGIPAGLIHNPSHHNRKCA
jgi:hypothetical protein